MKKKIGHNGTTMGSELEKIAYELFGNRFGGVFAADKVPKKLDPKKLYILNTDNSDEPGEHWVGLYEGYMYDSFARPPHKMSDEWKGKGWKQTDDDAEQRVTQMDCGHRTLAALLVAYRHGLNAFKKI